MTTDISFICDLFSEILLHLELKLLTAQFDQRGHRTQANDSYFAVCL